MYRPKNCTNCGKNKYQLGGNNLLQIMNPQMINEATIDRPLPDAETPSIQMSPFQELISKGVIEAPQGWEGTAQQYYDHVNTPQKSDKIKDLQRLGIGLQGARTGLSWLAGAVERNRQNQFDMTQQTALGMMNPMQVDDFQPNPYNLYMMKGGKLTKIVKDYNKWSNDAGPMDMTHGEGNKYLQQGGKLGQAAGKAFVPKNLMVTNNALDPRLFAYQDSVNYYDLDQDLMKTDYRRQVIAYESALRNQLPTDNPEYNKANAEYKDAEMSYGTYIPLSSVPNDPVLTGKNNSLMLMLDEKRKPNLIPFEDFEHVAPKQPIVYRPKKKKGGYEIDRMLVVRKLLPELLNLGRLGTRKYRGHGMKKGGTLTPNKAREILHDGTAHGQPLTDKQRKFFGAKSKGHTNYRGK